MDARSAAHRAARGDPDRADRQGAAGTGHEPYRAIISGDHEAPTRKLAESLGMDRYFAGSPGRQG